MSQAIEQVEDVFRDHGAGSALLALRTSAEIPDNGGVFRVMPAILPKAGFFGLKTLTGTPDSIYAGLHELVSGTKGGEE
jgi:ornithine cyclodeaminase/alanine dehydrogenase-like protein (mu-crystallin family)